MATDADSKPYDFEKSQDELALFEFREELEKILPPVSEIAQLAALLSHGRPFDSQSGEIFSTSAINLWEWCHQKRKDWINKQANMKLLRRKAEEKEAEQNFPKPKIYPVSFEEFLRLSLPKKRPEDRMKIYRESIRVSMRHGKCFHPSGNVLPIEKIPETTDEEIAAVISHHKATGFDEIQYQYCLEALRNFAEWSGKENRKKRAKSGADGKWNEAPPKK